MQTFESGDSGKRLQLRVNDEFAVELPETPTTGFRWSVTQLPSMIELVADAFEPPSAVVPGAPGNHHWVFGARRTGTGELRIELTARTPRAAQPTFFTALIDVTAS